VSCAEARRAVTYTALRGRRGAKWVESGQPGPRASLECTALPSELRELVEERVGRRDSRRQLPQGECNRCRARLNARARPGTLRVKIEP